MHLVQNEEIKKGGKKQITSQKWNNYFSRKDKKVKRYNKRRGKMSSNNINLYLSINIKCQYLTPE